MILIRRVGAALVWAVSAIVALGAVLVIVGLLSGYRPVVITTGSMGSAAPPGSVVVTRPVDDVEVGDVVVMQRDGHPTITHRVVDIGHQDGVLIATTKGDANRQPDVEPYVLGDSELVARWTVPHLGSLFTGLNDPAVRFAIVASGTVLLLVAALIGSWVEPRVDRHRTSDERDAISGLAGRDDPPELGQPAHFVPEGQVATSLGRN